MQSRYTPALQVIPLCGSLGASINFRHVHQDHLFVLDLALHHCRFPLLCVKCVNSKQKAAVLSLLPLRIAGFASERVITYWLSFDPDSRVLKYGMGHHMEETTLLSCALPDALGSLYRTCPKLVCLHGYAGPVQQRSLYETKLINTGGQRQVWTFRHNLYSKQLMVVSQPLAPTCLLDMIRWVGLSWDRNVRTSGQEEQSSVMRAVLFEHARHW